MSKPGIGQTGVEIEAMTGAAVAALTVYDMVKAVNKFVAIENLQLVSKTGGSSGPLLNPAFNNDQKGPWWVTQSRYQVDRYTKNDTVQVSFM